MTDNGHAVARLLPVCCSEDRVEEKKVMSVTIYWCTDLRLPRKVRRKQVCILPGILGGEKMDEGSARSDKSSIETTVSMQAEMVRDKDS